MRKAKSMRLELIRETIYGSLLGLERMLRVFNVSILVS